MPDATRVLPYFKKNNKIYVVFIKEYRNPIDKYTYAFPAGLIDDNEDSKCAALRELEEEIGATVININTMSECLFTTPGMSDETIALYEAEVVLNKKQNLEETEDISIEIVEFDKIPEFLKSKDFCMCSFLMAQQFYFKNRKN